jgi:enoyl-CoA hydratase/carnithine racemase
MSSAEILLVDRPFSGCAIISLNEPAAMNALSLALRRTILN